PTWNPGATDVVRALAVSGSAVYAGGRIRSIGGLAALGLARIVPAPVAAPLATVLAPNGGENVNVGTTRRLTWTSTASTPGVESVDVYLSRSGAVGPWELLAAGAPNTGAYDWPGTAPTSSGSRHGRGDRRALTGG